MSISTSSSDEHFHPALFSSSDDYSERVEVPWFNSALEKISKLEDTRELQDLNGSFAIPSRTRDLALNLHFLKKCIRPITSQSAIDGSITLLNKESKLTQIALHILIGSAKENSITCSKENFFLMINTLCQKQLMQVTEELQLNMPINDILDFIIKDLGDGAYLFSSNVLVISLFKDKDKGIFLFDSSKGVYDLRSKTGKQYFLNYLKKQNIDIVEKLEFYKLDTASDAFSIDDLLTSHKRLEVNEYTYKEPPISLNIVKEEGVTFAQLHFRDKIYKFFYNEDSRLVYNRDSSLRVRIKLILLLAYCPIATTIRMVTAATKSFFCVAYHVYDLLYQEASQRDFKKLLENLSDLVRIPFYSLQLYAALFYGLFRPFEARVIYNEIEKTLVRQTNSTKINDHYYTAYCFHPFGSIAEAEYEKTLDKLKKNILIFPMD